MAPPEDAVAIAADPAKDEKKDEKKDKSKDVKDDDALSAEDEALKEGLELAVERLKDPDEGVQKMALTHLTTEIRSATSSMTSVPKPLKFLRQHYGDLKTTHAGLPAGENKTILADILAVLAMTMAKIGTRELLTFKLAGTRGDLGSWGHEFVRSLAGEIGQEYQARVVKASEDPASVADTGDLLKLVDDIVPFHIQHNAEAEAIDLLIEVQQLKKLTALTTIDQNNFERVCLYLLRCADFMSDPDDLHEMLAVAYEVYKGQEQYPDAMRVAIRCDDTSRIGEVLSLCTDATTKKQLCLLLARHRVNFDYSEDEEMNELIGNNSLHGHFLSLGRDLDVLEPKTPEDIYKSHLSETGGFRRGRDASQQVDSARSNLASTFVNAFVNAGFGKDMLVTPEGNEWLYKNKEHGMLSAAASLGLIMLWNVEEGLTQIDKFLYSTEDFIKAGAALAIGIVSSGVRHESDPPIALLPEHLESTSHPIRCAAIVALGIAYAGSGREDVMEYLTPIVSNTENANITEVALAALSLGQVFVGTCNEDVGSVLVQRLMESSDAELDDSVSRFLCLGLGLLFLGKMEKVDAIIEAVKTVEHKMGQYAELTLETCAYAGTGNVLKVQRMLHVCAEHLTENAEHQSVAVIGIALVTAGEDVGSEMALRAFEHLLHYGELPVRRAVPLALALLSVSNPDYAIIDQLSRLSHDADAEVAQCAIIGLGIVSAGTNNSRVAGLLRQLAEHSRDAGHLFIIRIAQGLLHMGKGLISANPFHSDRLLMSGVGLGAILILLHSCLDLKKTLLGQLHYILYHVVSAMNPRMLLTVDEDMQLLPVSVRVGQAVETVGQAGRPKTITGFQTHTTPVLLGARDRAELAAGEYLPALSTLEGTVILRKNPDWNPTD